MTDLHQKLKLMSLKQKLQRITKIQNLTTNTQKIKIIRSLVIQ